MIGNLTYRQSLDIVNAKMKEAQETCVIDFKDLNEEVNFIVAEETIQRTSVYKIQNLIKKYNIDLHLCVVHPDSHSWDGKDFYYENSKGVKFSILGAKLSIAPIIKNRLEEHKQVMINKREQRKMNNQDFKKLDTFLKQLMDKSFVDGNNRISIVQKIGKAVKFGSQPHTFIIRIIEAYKDLDVSGRLVRSKMNVLFEVEYFASDYEDNKRAVKEVYDNFKAEWEKRNGEKS